MRTACLNTILKAVKLYTAGSEPRRVSVEEKENQLNDQVLKLSYFPQVLNIKQSTIFLIRRFGKLITLTRYNCN